MNAEVALPKFDQGKRGAWRGATEEREEGEEREEKWQHTRRASKGKERFLVPIEGIGTRNDGAGGGAAKVRDGEIPSDGIGIFDPDRVGIYDRPRDGIGMTRPARWRVNSDGGRALLSVQGKRNDKGGAG